MKWTEEKHASKMSDKELLKHLESPSITFGQLMELVREVCIIVMKERILEDDIHGRS